LEIFKLLSTSDPTVFTAGQAIIKPTSIMWAERYRDPGEFEIIAPLSSGLVEFLPIGCFISHLNTLEVMIVENHEVAEDNISDPFVKITGRSFESFLENRIVGMNQVRASSTISEYALSATNTWVQVVSMINDHIKNATYTDDNLPNVTALHTVTGTGVVEARTVKRTGLHRVILELLEMEDLGIKTIRRNPFGGPSSSSTETRIVIHKGNDKSAQIIFSWKSGDLDKAEYLWSDKKLKNSAVVLGRYVNTVVDTAGATKYNRRSAIVTADDIDGHLGATPSGAVLTDVINKMQVRGREAINSQNRVTITRADLGDVSKYQYRKDFEVGDLVSLDGNFGQIAVMRIIEYVEIFDENGESGHPTLSLPGE